MKTNKQTNKPNPALAAVLILGKGIDQSIESFNKQTTGVVIF